jgi:hypothetical protein
MALIRKPLYLLEWRRKHFILPAPSPVKIKVLKRWGGNGYWIESGTYIGETSRILAATAKEVHTIEPSLELFEKNRILFAGQKNVKLYHDLSENVIGSIIDCIIQDQPDPDVSIWLDGHYSQGITFKGPVDTPIGAELNEIERRVRHIGDLTILIDDARLFSGLYKTDETYPDLILLVDWAQRNNLRWFIEHDIFIITNRMSQETISN